jgi:hypothetical protein
MIPSSESARNPQESGLVPVNSSRFPRIPDRNRPGKHTEDGSSNPGRKAPYRNPAIPDKSTVRDESGTPPYTSRISVGTAPYPDGIPPKTKNLKLLLRRKTPEIHGTCIPYPGSENHRIFPATSVIFLYFPAGNGRNLTSNPETSVLNTAYEFRLFPTVSQTIRQKGRFPNISGNIRHFSTISSEIYRSFSTFPVNFCGCDESHIASSISPSHNYKESTALYSIFNLNLRQHNKCKSSSHHTASRESAIYFTNHSTHYKTTYYASYFPKHLTNHTTMMKTPEPTRNKSKRISNQKSTYTHIDETSYSKRK